MPIPQLEEEAKAKAKLIEALKQLAETTPDSLVRTELGPLNFKEGLPIFERTLRLYRELYHANLDNVPGAVLTKLFQGAQNVIGNITQIRDFDLMKVPNPVPARDNIIQQMMNSYNGHFDTVAPMLSYAIRMGTDFENLEKAARAIVEGMQGVANDQKARGDSFIKDAEETLEKIHRAAGEMGVAQHSSHFEKQAIEHETNSKRWLLTTGILAAVTLAAGILMGINLFVRVGSLTASQSIQLVVAKLIIFSILYSATVWSGRVYKSELHNYVINRHRQNALRTFEAFVKAAEDKQTKDSVLLQATRSIFSCQASGFTSSGDVPESPQLVEIIRSLSSTKIQD